MVITIQRSASKRVSRPCSWKRKPTGTSTFYLNFYDQVEIDQGRYQTHNSSSYNLGHLADGSICGRKDPNPECFRDFTYATPVTADYFTDETHIQYMPGWQPWTDTTGWYWMLYNKSAPSTGNVVGAFVGPASRAIGNNTTGYSPYILPDDGTGRRSAGFEFTTSRASPDSRIFPNSRYAWAIWVGTKGADLGPPDTTQNIGKQMNLHGGFNLNKIYRYILTFADPARGYGAMWNDPSVVQGVVAKLRSYNRKNPYTNPYLGYLYNATSGARGLYDMWVDPSGAKTHAAVVGASRLAQNFLNTMVNGEGIYNFNYQYWMGAVQLNRTVPFIDSVLGDATATAADKATIKAVASLFAYILYDEDFVPFNTFAYSPTGNGLGAGTANMPTQYSGYRSSFTFLLPLHPFIAPFVAGNTQNASMQFKQLVNQHGSPLSSTSYANTVASSLLTMLSAKMLGTDFFQSDTPRTTRFAEWTMQVLTPPEVRFKFAANSYSRGYPAADLTPRKSMAGGGDFST